MLRQSFSFEGIIGKLMAVFFMSMLRAFMTTPETQDFPRAGFFKRIAAIVYDLLIVVVLAMVVTFLNLILISTLDSNGIIDISAYQDPSAFLNAQWWFKVEIVAAIWFFYAWFWYDGGQTLGMRSWRLKVESNDGQPLTFKRTGLRAIYAILGLGNIMVLFTGKNKQALQDKLTNTRVVMLTKDANKKVYLRGVEGPEQQ